MAGVQRIGPVATQLLVIILIMVFLGACTSPYGPAQDVPDSDAAGGASDQGGTLLVGVYRDRSDGEVGAATVIPDIDLTDVEKYRVTLSNGPAGAPVPDSLDLPAGPGGAFEGPVEIVDLVPGRWTVTIEAWGTRQETYTVLLRGTGSDVLITAGESVPVEVVLAPPEHGLGVLSFSVIWPADQEIATVEYRLDHSEEGNDWTSLAAEQITREGTNNSAYVTLPDRPSGAYLLTVRLDAGPLSTDRYRAYAEEVVYVFEGMTTVAAFELLEDHFSRRPPEPGSWEDLAAQGIVVVNPDGSVTFTDEGYTMPEGEDDIFVDPDDYSVTFSGSGERRMYMDMPSVSAARLEIYGAEMTQGTGWGVFFHGSVDIGNERFSGFTLQFDPGFDESVIVRQWIAGGERTPFIRIGDHGLDLRQVMNVFVDIDGMSLRVQVEQPLGTEPVTIIDEPDITTLPDSTGSFRSDGFLGIRSWSNTDLSVEEIKLHVHD